MKQIPLSQGLFALVDDEDYDRLMVHRWYANRSFNTFYVNRKIKVKGKRSYEDGRDCRAVVSMHREILSATPGQIIDHRDGDGLNNQKSNLRLCNGSQNCMNRRKSTKQYTSIFKGVNRRNRSKNSWVASIRIHGELKHIGVFPNESLAALAYDAAAVSLFGEFARTNFPEEARHQ